MKYKLESRDDTMLMAESKEELKSVLLKLKEGSEKAGLKLNFKKIKIMASGPITSWQIDGGKNGNSDRLYLLGLQNLTVDVDCSHEIRRLLLPGRKTMTNLDNILKSRNITLLTKVPIVKAIVFSSSHVRM